MNVSMCECMNLRLCLPTCLSTCVGLYVCLSESVYVCMYVCICLISLYVCMSVWPLCLYVSLSLCVYVRMCVCVRVYVCTCVCVCVCVRKCLYVCISYARTHACMHARIEVGTYIYVCFYLLHPFTLATATRFCTRGSSPIPWSSLQTCSLGLGFHRF